MAQIIVNAQGTSSSSFSIGKRGVVIYQGYTTPTSMLGNNGDVYIRRGADCNILIKNEGTWTTISELNNLVPSIISAGSNQTIDITKETYVITDTSTNELALTISSASAQAGRKLTIKDGTGNASTNPITITAEASETFDGQSSVTISGDYTSVSMISDGTNWYII